MAKPRESGTCREMNKVGVFRAWSPRRSKKENLKKGKLFKTKYLILKRDRIKNLDVLDDQTVHSKSIHVTY